MNSSAAAPTAIRNGTLNGFDQNAAAETAGGIGLLLTGAGAYSVDARVFGRTRIGPLIATGLLILAIAAALLTWVALNGTNPIHFTAPPAA